MNGYAAQSERRLLQLLADRATEGLDAGATSELGELLLLHPQYDTMYLEPVAAALDLAMSQPFTEPLPVSLHERILADAERFFGNKPDQAFAHVADSASKPAELMLDRAKVKRSRSFSHAGWCLAAASLALAIAGWWPVNSTTRSPLPTPAEQYAEFVGNTDDGVRASWTGKEPGYENVTGDVVWSDANQRGFMRFTGLPLNDPETAQYQLWVVDPSRDSHPVDGGVFDVLSAGEVIIPVDVKLHVDQPKVFAITLEKPGGVVVSGGPLLVVGAVAG